jgi:uncharacterized membrane protein
MASRQGNLFGFPNMLLGLGAFAAVIVLGLTVLAGTHLHRMLWLGLNAGAFVGVIFVHWLIWQSLYEITRLCPYCAVVWTVTIAIFWYATLHNLKHDIIPVPAGARMVRTVVLESQGLLLAAWYGLVVMLVLTRFWS